MTDPTYLSDMELDEISLVTRGANPEARVLLYKSDVDKGTGGDRQAKCSKNHNRMNPGNTCKECGYVKKSAPVMRPFKRQPILIADEIAKGCSSTAKKKKKKKKKVGLAAEASSA